jgi:hypothetical protein
MTRRLTLALLLGCAAATASHAGPLYIGASYGNATVEIDEPSLNFDADDPSWKVFAGYRFLHFLGVEGGYLDLGSPSEGGVTVETTAWSAFGVGVLPLGPVGLFAKAGAVASDSEISGGGDDSSSDPAYGVGAEVDVWKITVRGEYEMFDIDNTDSVYLISVGAAWKF